MYKINILVNVKWNTYNHGQNSLEHLCYCVFYDLSLKKAFLFLHERITLTPLDQYNVENQKKLQVVVFNIACWV